MTVQLSEATGTLARTDRPGRVQLTIIKAGPGSSGHYPAETLQNAVQEGVFHKGLKLYGNHPTEQEQAERPEGNVWNIVGTLSENARWDEDQQAIVAEASVYPSVKDVIFERAEDIGASIRGQGVVESGTVTSLGPISSVDLVTEAGAGGAITELLESVRKEIVERNGGQYRPRHSKRVTEATDNDVRSYLRQAVDNAHDGPDQYAHLQDFDDTYVYFEVSQHTADGHTHSAYRQAYTRDGVNVTLTGEPERVERETSYTPATSPEPDNNSSASAVESASTATAGGAMEIKEAEYQRLSEAAGRVEVLENEKAEAIQRAEAAESKLAEADRRVEADAIVAAAFEGITAPKLKARLVENAIRGAEFDADAFKAEAEEMAAELSESSRAPKVEGFGDTTPVTESADEDVTEDDVLATIEEGRR